LLDRARCVLVVVDMQESFLKAMNGRDALTANVLLLCRAAQTLEIPVLMTTQNAERLGDVTPEVVEAAGKDAPLAIDKLAFSCVGSPDFRTALKATGRKQVLLCGVETHICITQTALDLFSAGYAVHVAPDAVTSRTVEKHKLGMERLRDNGIKPVATEAAIYEWLKEAGTPEFRQILALVK
jgi:nicotinamidase-related amidase